MSLQERTNKLKSALRGLGQDSAKQKKVQQVVGFAVFAVFIVSSILINSSVHAVFQSSGRYGYYSDSYGYHGSTTSSDAEPAAPSSLSCTTADPNGSVCSWTAPTLTTIGTSISTGGGGVSFYKIHRNTSSLTACSGGTVVTSTTASKTLESLSPSTTYYVAVCAVDSNGNIGNPLTGSFTTAASSGSGGSGGGGGTVNSPSVTPAPTTTPATPSTAPSVADINVLLSEAKIVANIEGLLHSIGVTARNNASEKSYEARIKTVLGKVGDAATTQMLINFVTYGTGSTQILGAGERLGVLNSYRSAYGKIPSTESEWTDVLKIANGRWPSEMNAKAEARAKATFKSIYKRNANMEQANDNAAVTVMAYGLRPSNRNLNSEKQAIKNFRGTFGRSPSLATDWDMVRAIAYSGAKR